MYFKGDIRERRLFVREPAGEADDGERETT